jgi:hypothetical protein
MLHSSIVNGGLTLTVINVAGLLTPPETKQLQYSIGYDCSAAAAGFQTHAVRALDHHHRHRISRFV